DSTYEAVASIFEKRLDGFGELFRMLSYEEIGSAAMMTRATAGVARGTAIFLLPGSEHAVRLGMTKLILPELGHVVRALRRCRLPCGPSVKRFRSRRRSRSSSGRPVRSNARNESHSQTRRGACSPHR